MCKLRVLLGLVLLLSSLVPSSALVAQSDAPGSPPDPAGGSPTYLPVVTADQGSVALSPAQDVDAPLPQIFLPFVALPATADAGGEMVIEESAVVPGEEPALNTAAKPASAADAPVDPSAVVPPAPPKDEVDAAAEAEIGAVEGWQTILNEGFEGAWPNTKWTTWDDNGSSYGTYTWDDEFYKPYSGLWSGWPVGGGANSLNPFTSNYPNNARSWMTYGPFSLLDARAATFSFNLWNQSEANYDYIGWYVSTNNYNFYGRRLSGNTNGWTTQSIDLANVPGLGNVLGKTQVWIAFIFTSDGSVTAKGPFVDNIQVRKDAIPCYGSMYAEYFSGRLPNATFKGWACESWFVHHDWQSGGPAISGVGADNFSARYTGSVPFAGGYYTFQLHTDDGARLWIDNVLVIDAWRDQATTRYLAARNLSKGYHSIRLEYYENGGGAYIDLTWFRTVDYHMRDGFHVFKIDLRTPGLKFETVMANDSTNVNQYPSPRERVEDMKNRLSGLQPLLAFNADYFGDGHGPEGLTVRNGARYDGNFANPDDLDSNEMDNSSFSVSYNNYARMGIQRDCTTASTCRSYAFNQGTYYNTVGGGPLFVANSARVGGSNSTAPCTAEKLPSWYCNTSYKWTAVGLGNNGRTLIVIATSENKSMDQAAAVMTAEGATQAMKLDGGGSTQVYYRPNGMVINSSRGIANAMFMYVPR